MNRPGDGFEAASPTPRVAGDSPELAAGKTVLAEVLSRGRVRGSVALLGPAFVASVAYIDPGNFATNFAAGAEYGYMLVWVIVMANLMAMLVQYLTAKAGLATGKSLPELCREAFGKGANIVLWIQAEIVAMATDLAEFVGAAVGLNLLFGIPLFGDRMVVILDTSAQTDDPHPYDRDRLTTLCEVPGARPIPWFQIQTKRQFARAWARRWVQDLPKGAKFDVFLVNTSLNDVFGKLNSANAGAKKTAIEAIEETKGVTGQDVLGALMSAIHLGGEKDKQAWSKGPCEVLYVSSSKPWLAPVTDEDHIGAAVALRAGWLQIPVHTVGVGNHPFAMMQVMSAAAGGTYLDLSK